jgi:hypothetical protein
MASVKITKWNLTEYTKEKYNPLASKWKPKKGGFNMDGIISYFSFLWPLSNSIF